MQDAKDAPAKPEAKGEVRPPSAVTKTPAEWAIECGFVDPAPKNSKGQPAKDGGRVPASEMKAWKHVAASAHAGWGTRLPIDLPLTRAEYVTAVETAMSLPLGDAKNDAALKRLAEMDAAAAAKGGAK